MRRLLPLLGGLAGLTLIASVPAAAADVAGSGRSLSYLYNLSSLSGTVPLDWVSLAYDEGTRELFVVDGSTGLVRIFNESGREVYSFGDDPELGSVLAVAPLETGELVTLSMVAGKATLLRCNFRGEPTGRVELSGLPGSVQEGFTPDALQYASGKLHLADRNAMRVVVVEPDGRFVAAYDLAALVGGNLRRGDRGLRGFSVDPKGNLLFTLPSLFRAFVVSPEGNVRSFGVAGSTPGKFNVVGGISADAEGTLYVTDVLRAVVMVFDRDFQFLGEFGHRGPRPGNLVAPNDLTVGGGKVFVTQSARRGVSVYHVVTGHAG